MSRSHLFMAALLAGAIAGAAADLPAGYEMHTDEEKIVFSEDFSQGMGSWAPRSGGRPIVIAPAMGTNGSACAMSVRDDAAAHPKLVREFRGEPGKIYYVSLRFRSDNVSYADDEQYARSRVSIHPFWIDNFDAAGKYLSGCYLIVAIPEGQSNDWEEIGKEFVMPPGCVRSVITLGGYVPGEGRKITGTLYWDDIKIIRKAADEAIISAPTVNLGSDGKVVFRVYDPQARMRSASSWMSAWETRPIGSRRTMAWLRSSSARCQSASTRSDCSCWMRKRRKSLAAPIAHFG